MNSARVKWALAAAAAVAVLIAGGVVTARVRAGRDEWWGRAERVCSCG
ncbi:MAG: hypothetical protein JWM10_2171, partial [Myxococcaceae bacterium]|nr:hypothetical protein [Myxococcaceae bacterium]